MSDDKRVEPVRDWAAEGLSLSNDSLVLAFETARSEIARLEAEVKRLREALERVAEEITVEPWEADESILCFRGVPVGMTIYRPQGLAVHEVFVNRGAWGDIAKIIIRAANAVKEGE